MGTEEYYKLLLERKLQYLAYEQSILGERYLRQTETFVELGLKSKSDLQEVKARCEGDIYRYETRKNSARLILLHLKQLINVSACDTLIIKDTVKYFLYYRFLLHNIFMIGQLRCYLP